jgi:hypothetical protein
MNPSLEGLAALAAEAVRRHWVSALLLLVTISVLLTIALMRWWIRRRWQRLLESDLDDQHELDVLPPLSSQDQQAVECIRQLRRTVWDIPEAELKLGVEAFTTRAVAVVRAIAAIYHPASEVPEYEATLLESLNLTQRVSRKITRFASVTPWKLLGNRKLSDYQRFYQLYRKLNENPLLQVLRSHPHLYRAARIALNIKNVSNPFYWAGRELSREGYFLTLRWFYLAFIGQVGREAMKLYSGRHFQREEERDAALVCHKLFTLTSAWHGPSPTEWATLVEIVADHAYLEPDVKVHILSRWAQQRLPNDVETQPLQTSIAYGWYRDGLKRLMKAGPRGNAERAQRIERELADLEKGQE